MQRQIISFIRAFQQFHFLNVLIKYEGLHNSFLQLVDNIDEKPAVVPTETTPVCTVEQEIYLLGWGEINDYQVCYVECL